MFHRIHIACVLLAHRMFLLRRVAASGSGVCRDAKLGQSEHQQGELRERE